MSKKIVLAGATGNLGPAILKGLVDAGHQVTVLTRRTISASDALPSVTYVTADLSDASMLASTIRGHYAVVSSLPMDPAGVKAQQALIDACLDAGVERFVPSTFGSDLSHPKTASLPGYSGKMEVLNRCKREEANSRLSFVEISCGPFLDWCIMVGLFLEPENHKVTYYEGGDVPFSTTTLATTGKALAAVTNRWDEFKNRTVRVQDAVVTQRQLVNMAKEVQADGREWTEEHETTLRLEDGAADADPYPYASIKRAIWGEGLGQKMTGLDNELLGIEELQRGQVKAVVARFC